MPSFVGTIHIADKFICIFIPGLQLSIHRTQSATSGRNKQAASGKGMQPQASSWGRTIQHPTPLNETNISIKIHTSIIDCYHFVLRSKSPSLDY